MATSIIKQVRKRSGQLVGFDQRKISDAIFKAAQAVGGEDRQLADELADVVVLTSDNPRREDTGQIIEEIRAGLADPSRVHGQADRRAAIAEALSLAAEGDVILIAGKGHETYQEFANRVVPFDDRQVVRELLAERK